MPPLKALFRALFQHKENGWNDTIVRKEDLYRQNGFLGFLDPQIDPPPMPKKKGMVSPYTTIIRR
jgi:hypothetical protein